MSDITAGALTRADALFILGFLAGGKSDPVLLALVEQLEARWTPAAPEGAPPDANPGLFSRAEYLEQNAAEDLPR